MQRIFISVFVLLMVACTGKPTQQKRSQKSQNLTEKTSIMFEETSHGFGTLQAGEIVLYTFGFENTGKHEYLISNVESDCGCVSVNFIGEPVKPGEKGWIEIEFDTSGLTGREYKTIEIRGNSNELKHLAIFATVKNEIIEIEY